MRFLSLTSTGVCYEYDDEGGKSCSKWFRSHCWSVYGNLDEYGDKQMEQLDYETGQRIMETEDMGLCERDEVRISRSLVVPASEHPLTGFYLAAGKLRQMPRRGTFADWDVA